MPRSDAFGSDPLSQTPALDPASAPHKDDANLLVRRSYHAETIKRLEGIIHWRPANRDTDQSQPMKTPNGTSCCVQRKRLDGDKFKYTILANGLEPIEANTLDELLQVMAIEPLR